MFCKPHHEAQSPTNLGNVASNLLQDGPVNAKRPHLPYLDGWRGIAIICVLFGHFSRFDNLGGIGVTVFFVLSGILMSRILFVDKIPLRVFYRRRLARIVPVFWLYIVVVFLGGWLTFHQLSVEEMLSSSLFLRTYIPDADIFNAALPIHHLWSLNVEEHCYIFLSLLSVVALHWGERRARVILTASSMLCLVAFVFYKYHPPVALSPFYLRTEVAAFPLLLSCAIFLWLRKWPVRIPAYVPVISFLAAFVIIALSASVLFTFVCISVLLAISVNTLDVAPTIVLKALSVRTLRWFGVCSYSIYIWQQPFFFFRRYLAWEYSNLAGLLAALVIASCSFYLFENPLRKWLSGQGSQRRSRVAAPAFSAVEVDVPVSQPAVQKRY